MGFEDYKPTIILIACQFMYAGVTLTGRAALLEDMSSRVFVVYRQFIAFLFIAPFAYFTSVTINQNIYFEGLLLASSSAASALGNLVPAITFIMAYTMGLEKIHLRSLRSAAKIIGTVLCVSGAVAMALLKGPKLLNNEFLPRNSLFHHREKDTWLLGCLFLLGSTCCWSLWLILQAHVSAVYPDHLSLTAWMCLIAALQSGTLTLIFEPHTQAWKLNSPLQLISCLYAGLVSAVTFFGQAWCISRRGPLFSAMFNPLCTVIVTIYACVFMNEEMYTGSLVGVLAVILGLYSVLWGKAKDHQEVKMGNDENAKVSDNISGKNDLEDPLLPEKLEMKQENNKL
ncbi:hypothetical protein ACJIZ3_020714 [Penstemon smallii]|uniref:WAT1-related protein n=1 Tax=Penstemon smallii TaxID=265156 RepID=A0ABD3SJM7_9LAMI